MKANNRELPPAIVLGGAHNALGIFRSLGRRGVEVIAIHTNQRDAALLSRFCTPVAPPCDPAVDEEKYVNFLLYLPALGAKLPALVPTGDSEVLALSRHRNRLQQRYRYVMPEHAVVEALIDKEFFAGLAERHGMLTPQSYSMHGEAGLEELSRKITYPCVIKPALSRAWGNAAFQGRFGAGEGGWIKRVLARSRDDFLSLYRQLIRFEKRLVVQEYIEGGDDALYDFYSYLDENSDPLGCFMIRKRRTLPIDGNGIGTCVESVWDEALAETSLRFLKAIRYRGNSAVCFKRCARTGRFYLIEVNARIALHHSLATDCGVDLSHMAYVEAIGEKPPRVEAQRRNARWLSFWDDFAAYRRYRKRGDLGLRDWIKSLTGPKTHCYFAWDDPRPFLMKAAETLLAESLGRDRVRRFLAVAQRSLLQTAYYTGVLWAVLQLDKRKQKGLALLMYHSIGTTDDLEPALCVSKTNFERQLRYITRHHRVVSLEEAVERMERGAALPDNAVAITFDDGYRDNYEAALPLLQKYGCTATFFIATESLKDRRALWPNQLYRWLTKTSVASLTLSESLQTPGGRNSLELKTDAERVAAFRFLKERLWPFRNSERNRILADIAAQLGFSAADNPGGRLAMLTWSEVRQMAEAGMTIGSHTVTHPVLSSLSGEEAIEELAASKAALEGQLDRPITLFAYPFGGLNSFNAETQTLVKQAGYKAACTTLLGLNKETADRWTLRRIGVHDDPPCLFAFKSLRSD